MCIRDSIISFLVRFLFLVTPALIDFLVCFVRFCLRSYGSRGPRARNMNLVDRQRAAEQGRRGKLGTFPAGSVSNMRLDEALEWAAGALAKIQVCPKSHLEHGFRARFCLTGFLVIMRTRRSGAQRQL